MNARTYTSRRTLRLGAIAAAVVGAIALFAAMPTAEETAQMAEGYISGVVESSNGPEAGVWVIAETEELETRFAKIVVTADDGRFVMPQLPDATYDVWVRGYGLVDSDKVQLSPTTDDVTLEAVVAPDEQAAAEYYPGNYWYSLIEPPPASEFPGTGPDGNGIAESMRTQQHWVDVMKQGCQLCHQIGNTATRVVQNLDDFDSTAAAWDHRVQTGQRGTSMSAMMSRMGRERALEMFADWTDRIAAGETPPRPPRPDGVEQNLVVTLWDWGQDSSFIHDEITTDKRNPTVNGGGPVYGVSAGHGSLTVVNPIDNSSVELTIPVRPADPNSVPSRFPQEQLEPSYYWGDQLLWGRGGPDGNENSADPHNPMMDHKGRVWMTSTVRARPNPEWCMEGSDNKFAQYLPLSRSGRQASFYDPAIREVRSWLTPASGRTTCSSARTTTTPSGSVATATRSAGSTPSCTTRQVTSSSRRAGARPSSTPTATARSRSRGTSQTARARWRSTRARDTRIVGFGYGIIASPTDDSIWITRTGPFPGRLVRLDRG